MLHVEKDSEGSCIGKDLRSVVLTMVLKVYHVSQYFEGCVLSSILRSCPFVEDLRDCPVGKDLRGCQVEKD